VSRNDYYQDLKALARSKREEYAVATDHLGLREMRAIYRHEDITIDLWPHRLKKVRAAYMVVDGEPHVLLNKAIKPVEPRLFSMAHELKHHFVDRYQAVASPCGLGCQEYVNYRGVPQIEIGAEVFAAEFIFPEREFREWAATSLGTGDCSREDVVRLKRACPAKVSYTFLVKRLERLRYVRKGALAGVQFRKLEEELFGPPIYKRIRHRRSR
jgi:Zn-dependent peptidase ImmA (M78 family)